MLKHEVIEVVENDRDRLPITFKYKGKTYHVISAMMCSFGYSKLGNSGFEVICKVAGQKHDISIWLGGNNEWFVEYEEK